MGWTTVKFIRDWKDARVGRQATLRNGVAAELVRRRFAVLLDGSDPEPATASPESYASLTQKELREACKGRGLSTNGKKQVLMERLRNADRLGK